MRSQQSKAMLRKEGDRVLEIVCFRDGFRARKNTLCGSVEGTYHKKVPKSIICCMAAIKPPFSQLRAQCVFSPGLAHGAALASSASTND
jgi:hypothetical protein